MIELDELAELAWLPVALLLAVMAWRSRSALLAGAVGGGWLRAWRDCQAGLPGSGIAGRTGRVVQWALGADRTSVASSGNGAFASYSDDALRKLEDEQREFRAFLERLRRARDQSEFDAFMADRAR